jgi:signal-transduction protein with cAMP-binding, CBS, and nucleotidyltransferase domain
MLLPATLSPVKLRELMTERVITADRDDSAAVVAQTMRDEGVGSVVVTDAEGDPAGIVTDRDLTLRVLAEGRDGGARIGDCATAPLVTGEPDMALEEAAALMVRHRVRRLPIVEAGDLAGIVTLDDIAVRTGNLEVAQRMTAEVIEGALPDFFFHERG